ncbi:hypothetical protein DYBT9275_04464 [Dyadobacter sp. CECT 9275]|uniref:Uncharacterized protein n=1 Tax=Dyadobacter helix TaxID=2822344 RepID=A0A916JGR4_9BACT|nr:hypothetical protein [Dyadobacter sp. CECT 9275]CAG5009296.1 hypothetical protein DYBT9275_04464 [Dyadobacter sp. CECT 9275]
MGELKLYDSSLSRDQIKREREAHYLAKSSSQKFTELLSLIHLSIELNDGKPLKFPQGKGLVIRKDN